MWEDVLYKLQYQLPWMIAIIIAPELLVSLAFGSCRAASQGLAFSRRWGKESVQNWTRMQVSFANMGGLRFEMTMDGMEIPQNDSGMDAYASMFYLTGFVAKQQAPFNKYIRKCKRLCDMLCLKVSCLIRPFSRPDKGKAPMKPNEPLELSSYPSAMSTETSEFIVDASSDLDFNNIELVPTASLNLIGNSVLSEAEEPYSGLSVTRREFIEHSDASADFRIDHIDLATAAEICFFRASVFHEVEELRAGPSDARRQSIDLGEVDLTRAPCSDIARVEDEPVTLGGLADLLKKILLLDTVTRQESSQPDSSASANEPIYLYLNAFQVVAAQNLGILDDIPDLTDTIICDMSKANSPLNIIAFLALLWFFAGIIVKKYTGETISQLELSSMSYVLCCVIAFALYWSMPKGIERPITYQIVTSNTVRPVTVEDLNYLQQFGGSSFLSRNFVPPFGMDGRYHDPQEPIPTGISLTQFAILGNGIPFFDDDFAGTLVGVIFGTLYLVGWDSNKFTTIIERIAWKGVLIAITSSLIPYSIANAVCTVVFHDIVGPGGQSRTHVVHSLSLYSLLGLYILARLWMLGGMFREFFSAP
jgi:hypothetical protein